MSEAEIKPISSAPTPAAVVASDKTTAQEVTVHFKERSYTVYQPQAANQLSLDELQKALASNRALLTKCQTEFKKAYLEAQNPAHFPPKPLNLTTTTHNALMACVNISILIPQITLRGGDAQFEMAETLPVQTRIERMRDQAEREANFELMPKMDTLQKPHPTSSAYTAPPSAGNPYATATLIVAIAIIVVLLLFSVR